MPFTPGRTAAQSWLISLKLVKERLSASAPVLTSWMIVARKLSG